MNNYDQIMAQAMEASEKRMVRYNKIGGQTNEQKTSQTRKDTQKSAITTLLSLFCMDQSMIFERI